MSMFMNETHFVNYLFNLPKLELKEIRESLFKKRQELVLAKQDPSYPFCLCLKPLSDVEEEIKRLTMTLNTIQKVMEMHAQELSKK